MTETKALLELTDVTKHYDAPDGSAAESVLAGVTLSVERGESVAIVGPSGSGKSTLLNIIGALDRPSGGSVLLEGLDISQLGDSELAAIRSRDIGFVFQLHHLLPQCTVLENVLVPTLAAGGSDAEAVQRARRLLAKVGLEERLEYRPGQISGGERQRVATVRALINRPKLLLADEPTGSLDRAAAGNIGRLLVDLNREEGVTLLVVTHSLELASLMDRVLILRGGLLQPEEATE